MFAVLRWTNSHRLLALGLLLAVPALAYFFAPLRSRREGNGAGGVFVDAGPVADLPGGQWHLRAVEVPRQDAWKKTRFPHAVWVRREGKGDPEITVLSSLCPHLGCPIDWHPDQEQFVCPCHRGTFDPSGRRAAGPPPRSMDRLAHEVRGGRLWVRWQEFKIGVADRVPVSG